MKYDFTSILDRRGKDAAAYDNVGAHVIAPARPKEGFDIIPMWVADMNFPVVPTITEAIIARAQHPSFGYFFPTDKYYDSIVQWHEKRNGVTGLTKEHIGYENGVLGGVVSALNVLCSRGDNVLVSLPHLQRLYILSDQCRVFHRPLSTGSGRARHLAHGLRGHGEEDRGQPHSHRTILLPPQPHRPGLGALGAGEGHGDLPAAWCLCYLGRDLV